LRKERGNKKMKKLQFRGKLVRYERKNNSYYGNPRYYGFFENEKGEYLSGTTASNASCAYTFLNNTQTEKIITFHETKAGNIVIDYMEEV